MADVLMVINFAELADVVIGTAVNQSRNWDLRSQLRNLVLQLLLDMFIVVLAWLVHSRENPVTNP